MVYRFGDGYELDGEQFELRRAGGSVAVEPQVFDVLAYLVDHRDRLVTKEELLDNIWGDRFVSESALTSRLKSARRAVGDDGRNQSVIKTVHGRGYRFVAEVGTVDAAAGASGGGDRRKPASPDADVTTSRVTGRDASPVAPDGIGPPSAPGWSSAGPGPRERAWPLLGRGKELAAVARRVRDQECGGILLTGAAGVGKTRLADECAQLASQSGLTIARAAGHPEARSLPLAALAHVLPPEVTGAAGPELDLASLFHRARASLAGRGGGQRLLLIIDDVDWLDDLSLALVASLVSARAAFAICTERVCAEPVSAIEHLVKDGHLTRVELSPLPTPILETILYRVLGAPVAGPTLDQLAGASLGNPGVLRQLVESSLEAGALQEQHGLWRLTGPLATSATLRGTVRERLADLGRDARRALELLAVAGHLGLELLAALSAGEVLDELDRRGLLELKVEGRRTAVALAHPLFGEVLRQDITPLRNRGLRTDLAGAVEGTGARRREDRVRLVAWYLDSGEQVAREALLSATRLALVQGDDRTAERLLARATAAGPTVHTLQLEAELHFRRGESAEVERILSALDDVELEEAERAEVIRRRVNNIFYGLADYATAFELIDVALEQIHEPPQRELLAAQRVMLRATVGHLDRALAEGMSLLTTATGNPRLELLRATALALTAAGRGDEALPCVTEGRLLHTEMDPSLTRPGLSIFSFCEISALTELGRLDEAERAVARASERPPADPSWLHLAAARLHLLQGRTDLVRASLEPMGRTTRALARDATERWVVATLASSLLLEGRVDEAAALFERVAALGEREEALFDLEVDRARAWLLAASEGQGAARAHLVTAAERARTTGRHALEIALVHDIVRFGGGPDAVDRVAALASGPVHGSLASARARHARGLLDDSADAIASAVRSFAEMGAVPLAAEAAGHLAAARRRAGDDEGASDAADLSDRLSRTHGTRLTGPVVPAVVGRAPLAAARR
jgi:DNA-binding winged helix-turn-helix (wHTH) protein/tetratricopeptide (TPR) repeat protein